MNVDGSITESLRQAAADLLSKSEVAVVIGYGSEDGTACSVPLFVRKPEDARLLEYTDTCCSNLAVYLPRKEIRAMGRVAIVLKGCDLRAVNVLLRENVINREDVYLIGIRCGGMGDPAPWKCSTCRVHDPQGCDLVLGEPFEETQGEPDEERNPVTPLEAKSLEERWEFWQGQLSKCIRCYACRQVCPLCYCKRCIVEKSTPQWVETSPQLRGNLAWNVARALHLTGRCVGCGECERVCPMDIPLGAINGKMAQLVEEWFGFTSGLSPEEKGSFSIWSPDDPEEGIL